MAANEDKVQREKATGDGRPVTLSPCHLVTLSEEEGRKKPIVGLIGGIGSGKSQVAAAFARRGARVIAGDELAHAALRQPELRGRVVARWGRDVLGEDGEVRRRRLAEVVFADEGERRALEAILHPWIRRRIVEAAADALADPAVRLVVLDAAVMLEAGWEGVCDRLVYIDAPREVRLRRLAGQRGWTAEEAAARERAQLPLTEKAARADHVLDNATTLDNLQRQVDDLLHLWGLGQPGPRTEPGPGGPGGPSPPRAAAAARETETR
jgi:dephospho-CoA kinase